ncbi:MAG: hypothetical protein KJ718_01165 [Nanoarchaeota archaeon]|nr:hypothetical protein [Nanoarchaeota archaeon]
MRPLLFLISLTTFPVIVPESKSSLSEFSIVSSYSSSSDNACCISSPVLMEMFSESFGSSIVNFSISVMFSMSIVLIHFTGRWIIALYCFVVIFAEMFVVGRKMDSFIESDIVMLKKFVSSVPRRFDAMILLVLVPVKFSSGLILIVWSKAVKERFGVCSR